jgi:hypothetical protein
VIVRCEVETGLEVRGRGGIDDPFEVDDFHDVLRWSGGMARAFGLR